MAANRFCASCGAPVLASANFCVECGERLPGATAPRARFSFPLPRYAPVLIVATVVAVGGGAVVMGVLSPKTPPSVPRHNVPPASGAANTEAPQNLPEGHPPIAIPDQVKEAIRDMAKKAEAAPDDAETWKRLAEVQYRAGQLDPSYLPEAAASYRHVVEREPHNLEAIRNLGNIAFDQDQHDIAVGYYEQYLKEKPDDLEVQTDLGTMYLSAGKADRAIQQYQSVLQTNPSFFQAQFNLAIAYRSLGQNDKLIAALEKARTLAADDKTRAQVDQLLARAKNEPAAGAPAGSSRPAAGAPAPSGGLQADLEAVFRKHPILGSKVQRIEWAGPESAKVYIRDFPMDQMPEEMRTMFQDRMKGRIKEQKDAHQVAATTRFELIDEATGKVMDTISE
jgi:tetratricopeptide (TPR) repeat protein